MAGGEFTGQNKRRPGAYINIVGTSTPGMAENTTGVVALPLALDFGPEKTIVEVSATSDLTLFGHDLGSEQMLLLREALKRASRVLVGRVGTGAKATATVGTITATALYGGARGNDIKVVAKALVDDPTTFSVETYLGARLVDAQNAKTVGELKANVLVKFSGTGAITAASVALSAGTDTAPVTQDYMDFFGAVQVYTFNTLALPISDSAIKTAGASFIKRLRSEEGKYCQLVLAGHTADTEAVINVKNGVVLADGTALTAEQATAWVAGARAAAGMSGSLTYTAYDGAVDVAPRYLSSEITEALGRGEFVFTESRGRAVVEQDINSLVTYSSTKTKEFAKNAILAILDGFANESKQTFEDFYIGSVRNTVQGRDLFAANRVERLIQMQTDGLIENFSAEEDVKIQLGNAKDSVVMTVGIEPTDAMEKLYMTVTMV